MTTTKGNGGVVQIGVNTVAEMVNWSVTETEGTVEDTALGDTSRSYDMDDLPTWTASLNCHYDPSDTNGQAVLLVGESVDLVFGALGTASGKEKLSGTGLITSRQIGDVANAAIVPLQLQIQGTGVLTHSTYSA